MSLGQDFDLLYERRLRETDPIQVLNKSIQKPAPHGNSKTYCMDFDGVLHYHEPGSGIDGPFNNLLKSGVQMAKRIKAAGHKLVILTARPKEQWHDIEGLLKGNGVKVDEVTNVKPPAEYYVDDRAIAWPQNMESRREAIESFGRLREGPGSGNWGHQGRPGQRGGSGPGGEIWRATGEPAPQKAFGPKNKRMAAAPGKGIARGLFGKPYKQLDADQKKKVREALKARGIIRPKGSTEAKAGEKELKEAAILSVKHLGGGINAAQTKLVELEGGIKAVFKAGSGKYKGEFIRKNITDGKDPEREVAAWKVASLTGYEDIVAPAVLRTVDGKEGSMMKFWDGQLAANIWGKEQFDGPEDLHRAAMFDYVIGNEDRHSGNWLVSAEGKLQLIDHGLSFPNEGEFSYLRRGNSYFLKEVSRRERNEGPLNSAMTVKEAGKPFVENKEKILDALKSVGLSEGSIKGVSDRIDRISRKDNWTSLFRLQR